MKMKNMLMGGVVALACAAGSAQAATWDLTKTGTQSWDVDANWTTAPFPNAEGATADLRVNIAAALNVNLNQAITLGTLYIGDTNQSHTTTVAGNGGSLIMDVASGTALITKTYTGTTSLADTISANILLNDNVVVNNTANHVARKLILSGVISGVGRSLEVTGGGTQAWVVMSNANTYDGTTTITSGNLQLGNGVTGGNGSVAGSIVNNATLNFNNADAQSFSGANYSGTGTLLKSAAGTLTLTGATTVRNLSIGLATTGGSIVVDNGATLSVGSGSANNLYVGYNSSGTSGAAGTGTLDASAATSFAANVGTFSIGSSAYSGSSGTLKLSNNNSNTITAATAVYIGWDTALNASSNSGAVTSGGNVSIATPKMGLGTSKTATGTYTQTAGTLTLAGTTATGTELFLGYTTNNNTTVTATGTMDLSGGVANLKLSKLVMADNNGTGAHTKGNLLLSNNAANHLEIKGAGNVVTLGLARNTGGNATADIATLTIGNLDATSAIESTTSGATAVLIASKTGSGTVKGVFNFNGGTLKITTVDGGAAIAGGGGSSELNLSGGAKLIAGSGSANWIHSLSTATIGTGDATIDTADYDIVIAQGFSGDGGLIKAGNGTLELSGTNTYGGDTVVQAGLLNVSGTMGGNLMTVKSGGTLGGNGTINATLVFESGAQLAFSPTDTITYNGVSAVSFTGFSVASLVGLTSAVDFGTYTLIAGNVNLTTGVANVGSGAAYDLGGGKSAYFQDGSLQLVVIPEPATLSLIGMIGIAMLLRRRIVKT